MSDPQTSQTSLTEISSSSSIESELNQSTKRKHDNENGESSSLETTTTNIENNKKIKNDPEIITIDDEEEEEDENGNIDLIMPTTSNLNFNLELNPGFIENVSTLKEIYQKDDIQIQNEFVNENVKIIQKPFKVVQLLNILKDKSMIKSILDLISYIKLKVQRNDLCRLRQSEDLQSYPFCKVIIDFFREHIKPFVEEMVGMKFANNIDLTISKYEQNDYLLCHDDRLEGRKVAFILYLVDEQWSENYGGQLELFSCSETNEPIDIIERIKPQFNSMIFFEVHSKSFHQVSEVLTSKSVRWSLNGWFHLKDNIVNEEINFVYPSLTLFNEEDILHDDLRTQFKEWINPSYLYPLSTFEINKKFCQDSRVILYNFFTQDKYRAISKALKSEQVKKLWEKFKRPLFGQFEYISWTQLKQLPDILIEFALLIHSKEFQKYLARLTCLKFVRNNSKQNIIKNNKKYFIKSYICQWKKGHYTLSNDINPELKEKAIDIDIFFNVPQIGTNETNDTSIENIITIDDDDDDDDDEDEADEPVLIHINQPSSSSKNPTQSKSISSSNKKEPIEVIILDDDEDDDDKEDGNDDDDDDQDDDDDEDEDESDNEESNKVVHLNNDDDSENDSQDEDDFKGGDELSGNIIYIDNESNHLAQIKPINNALSIIFRTNNCQRFCRYLDNGDNDQQQEYHHLFASFVEVDVDSSSDSGAQSITTTTTSLETGTSSEKTKDTTQHNENNSNNSNNST